MKTTIHLAICFAFAMFLGACGRKDQSANTGDEGNLAKTLAEIRSIREQSAVDAANNTRISNLELQLAILNNQLAANHGAVPTASEVTTDGFVLCGTDATVQAPSSAKSGMATVPNPAPTPTLTPTAPTVPATPEQIRYLTYKVKAGDTWENIAARVSISPQALFDANGGTLEVGREIKVPVLINQPAANTELVGELRAGFTAVLQGLQSLQVPQVDRLSNQSLASVASEYATCPTCQTRRQAVYYRPEPTYYEPVAYQPVCYSQPRYSQPYYQSYSQPYCDYGGYSGGGGVSLSYSNYNSNYWSQNNNWIYNSGGGVWPPRPEPVCPPGSPTTRQLGWQPGDTQYWNHGTGRNATTGGSNPYAGLVSRGVGSSGGNTGGVGGTPSAIRQAGGWRAYNAGGITPAALNTSSLAPTNTRSLASNRSGISPASTTMRSPSVSRAPTMSRPTTTMRSPVVNRAPSRAPSVSRAPMMSRPMTSMRAPSRAPTMRAPSMSPRTMGRPSMGGGSIRSAGGMRAASMRR